ncbi:amidohydrolase family protein [Amycolatopsis aidingensis]|uniref:hypothetical protein n=1 Tax=Amycolatopsis aidingensis TaxID=2842453 RepID=UPI001C0B1741|nr:hypothetical protein [Amycolatopsis aidingensis]
MRAELHLHFHGCIRPLPLLRHLARSERVLWDWYEREMAVAYGSVPPTRRLVERYRQGDSAAAAEFARLFVFGDEDGGNFGRFQAKANLLWVAANPEDPTRPWAETDAEVARFAAEIRADHRRQRIDYAELRVSAEMVAAAQPPRYAGSAERFAVTLSRSDPWRDWDRVRALALGPRGDTITGIDFCGMEEGHPPKDKAELGAHRLGHAIALGVDPALFGPHTRTETVAERRDQIAYDLRHEPGLRAAGVWVDPSALRAELDRLTASPGTATITIEYEERRLAQLRRRQEYAIQRVHASGAVIEVCPTSNRRIGGIADPAHHPVHRFLSAGLPFVVSSDDPGLFGTTLDAELDWVCTHTGGAELRRHLLETARQARSEVRTGRAGH